MENLLLRCLFMWDIYFSFPCKEIAVLYICGNKLQWIQKYWLLSKHVDEPLFQLKSLLTSENPCRQLTFLFIWKINKSIFLAVFVFRFCFGPINILNVNFTTIRKKMYRIRNLDVRQALYENCPWIWESGFTRKKEHNILILKRWEVFLCYCRLVLYYYYAFQEVEIQILQFLGYWCFSCKADSSVRNLICSF